MVYDTVFYTNGRAFYVKQHKIGYESYESERHTEAYYDKNGTLLVAYLPDSLELIPFKDNVDCYYGLKNKRGDTVVAQRYDQIEPFANDLWKAYEGTKVVLLRGDGKVLSPAAMEDISTIDVYEDYNMFDNFDNMTFSDIKIHRNMRNYQTYFNFKINGKFGILDRTGKVIVPPLYPNFISHDSTATFFQARQFNDTIDDIYQVPNVVDRQGKYLFDNRYPHTELAGLANFFKFSKTLRADTSLYFYYGLANQSGEILLENTYCHIEATQEYRAFWVAKGKESLDNNGNKEFKDVVYGLFDPFGRRWLLPCAYEIIHNNEANELILVHAKTHKFGLVSRSGEVILPFVYDTISTFNRNNSTYAVAQNGRYQIYDLTNRQLSKDAYEYLKPVTIPTNFYVAGASELACFVAQKKTKWGLIDLNGNVIKPFDYDYAGYEQGEYIVMVKGNHADLFGQSFFPLPEPDEQTKRLFFRYQQLRSFELVGSAAKKVFVVNSKNRVSVPPQYKVVQSDNYWELLENDAKQRQLLFKNQEVTLPFPFDKPIAWANVATPIVILYNIEPYGLELVNLKTRATYQIIKEGGLSVDAESGSFFVKNDPPVSKPNLDPFHLPDVNSDTFLIDDNHWKMFDSLGKPLTTNDFRYPINFTHGVGIGAIGDKFGIWRPDGTTVAPPQYENAHFTGADEKQVVVYQNIGLKNWMLLLDAHTGKTRIGIGRYDGISRFHGKYALVSLGDKVGLVDTLGLEIIAPMSLDNDKVNLIDSLNSVNIERLKAAEASNHDYFLNIYEDLPIRILLFDQEIVSPDSMALPNPLRNRVWHYLLQTQVNSHIKRADYRKIVRAETFKTYYPYRERANTYEPPNGLKYIFVDSLHIAFALTGDSSAQSIFRNYWHTKKGWELRQLSDILNLSRDNVIQLNNLMREKLRKLENKEIDCGESSSFVERVTSTFLTHTKGLSFYFTYGGDSGSFSYVPITLTWAELKPFRTPQ